MDIQDYVVTLGVRPAELSGLKELPGSSKDRLRPVLLLAPWLATSPLSKALKKFEDAYPARAYFVDVDRYYEPSGAMNEAKLLWQSIARVPSDLGAWWELLSDFPLADPCLLMAKQPIERARDQINWAREHNRNFCIRIELDPAVGSGFPNWMPELVEELSAEGAVDYAIVFEFGWVEDPLTMAAIASGYVRTFFANLSAEVPITISCTSFPRNFTRFDGMSRVPFSNRELIAQVRRATNHPKVIYGDWGTTRPRSYGIASKPKNRIDFPSSNLWLIARDQALSIDFKAAAERIVGSDLWTGDLGVWGEQLIEGTAAGQAFAIDTMPKMYAARINIHLHRQAFYDELPAPSSLDEEWSDDL